MRTRKRDRIDKAMIDLHCHILPGIDDGAADLSVSIEMAKAFVADGVSVVACTPHILPGLYHNTGPQIRQATAQLQQNLDREGIPLQLVTGADNHIVPNFVTELRSGHLLSLADTRYVLVEPPHHVAPPSLGRLVFQYIGGGLRSDPHPSGAANAGSSRTTKRSSGWFAPGFGCRSPLDLSLALLAEMRDTGPNGCSTRDVSIFWQPTPMT